MEFSKIVSAYKEEILLQVDLGNYDKVEILNKSMKFLSESVKTTPVVQPAPIVNPAPISFSTVTHEEIEDFVLKLCQHSRNGINASEAIQKFYKEFHPRFTNWDYQLNRKGYPRWQNRFWSVTSNLRKDKILLPNKGIAVNRYIIASNR